MLDNSKKSFSYIDNDELFTLITNDQSHYGKFVLSNFIMHYYHMKNSVWIH